MAKTPTLKELRRKIAATVYEIRNDDLTTEEMAGILMKRHAQDLSDARAAIERSVLIKLVNDIVDSMILRPGDDRQAELRIGEYAAVALTRVTLKDGRRVIADALQMTIGQIEALVAADQGRQESRAKKRPHRLQRLLDDAKATGKSAGTKIVTALRAGAAEPGK